MERTLNALLPAAALFCASLAAAPRATAQNTEIVYMVSGSPDLQAWAKTSTRPDHKLAATSFSFDTQIPAVNRATGKGDRPTGEAILQLPMGDPALLWWQRGLSAPYIPVVLVEFASPQQKAGQRAPFAVRLLEVSLISVKLSKARGDGGLGIAEVTLRPAVVEVFSTAQDATGATKPSQDFSYNFVTRGLSKQQPPR